MRPIDADALLNKLEETIRGFETILLRLKTREPSVYLNEGLIFASIELVKFMEEFLEKAPTIERPRGEWISVEDRLPDPFVTVLVNMPQEKPLPTVNAGYISKDGEWVGGMFKRDKDEVTHWMPLPEAPDMRGE